LSGMYTVKGGKKLRRGYTTGSCAAAAAKAAVYALFSGENVNRIRIDTPAGVQLNLELERVGKVPGGAVCAVRKDSGDDPDVTAGALVFARAREREAPGIEIAAGEGIGRVVRPGLPVPPGQPAINPVPLSMIHKEVAEVLPPGRGVRVEISIPGGEKLAEKTFNDRLGIQGGLSILGTTGLVEPMSDHAFKETLALEVGQVVEEVGKEGLVLVPGNHGKKVACGTLTLDPGRVIRMGNEVGFALDRCLEHGVKNVLLVGHLGKLFKVAAGIFQTHSRTADGRFEVIAAHAVLLGASAEMVQDLYRCSTTEAMLEILDRVPTADLFDRFAARVSTRAREHGSGAFNVGTVLFSLDRGILGMDVPAKEMQEGLR